MDERTMPIKDKAQIAHHYPEPLIPIAPVLSSYSCKWKKQSTPSNSVLSLPSCLHVSSGRAAIALALEHAGIGQADEVLIPAYHCESMVSPVRWRNATPVFYQINEDASIKESDIASKITSRTKAIIATHYFGFPQNLNLLRSLCDKKNILLIEDCAHAFFGEIQGHAIGSWGDYAIASSMKFFPVYDGGILASRKLNFDDISFSSPPLLFDLKSLFNVLERSISFKRMGVIGHLIAMLLQLKSFFWSSIKRIRNTPNTQLSGPSSSEGGYGLDKNWIHKKISASSKYIIEHADYKLIHDLRRSNFKKIDSLLKEINGIQPLHESLPDGVAPLVYPVFVSQPEKYFHKLKIEGVPIWRFGEYLDESIDESLCSNSVMLSTHIFQFPCHQELKDDEIQWMASTIKRILTE